jgi:hypothetical protein
MRIVTVLCFLVVLMAGFGCGATHVVLQHPETKDIVQCKGDALANWNPAGATKACAEGYEKAGYVRLSGY